jgi:hypothetical protein
VQFLGGAPEMERVGDRNKHPYLGQIEVDVDARSVSLAPKSALDNERD